MHHYRLRPAGGLRVAMGRTQRDHFVRTGDDLRDSLSCCVRLGQALKNGGMIGSEVRENVRNSGFIESVQEFGGGSGHGECSKCIVTRSVRGPKYNT